ncbi:MAG: hypothetical protein QNI87_04285 [Erythrobacter sp.]|uniref:hypothetical protein n=1 Tax=Erythrobacter sp. TaxID=1042 RepID=UPI002601B04D|nr:hypothetical protein [Erythrobacter sp.]MDJ0977733.1 hypothetical protein [Erythrobacter sp.]
MQFRHLFVSLVSAAALGVGASASACDRHGPDQAHGFQRYNPFAQALHNLTNHNPLLADEAAERRVAEIKRRPRAERDETDRGRAERSDAAEKTERDSTRGEVEEFEEFEERAAIR